LIIVKLHFHFTIQKSVGIRPLSPVPRIEALAFARYSRTSNAEPTPMIYTIIPYIIPLRTVTHNGMNTTIRECL